VSATPFKTALLLAGGGARGAYQVGVLRSVARAFPDLRFPILTGVSAGAINSTMLANSASDFPDAVEELAQHWESLTLDQVFRTNFTALGANVARWMFRVACGGRAHLLPPICGMVDTDPLRRFLMRIFGTNDGVIRGIAKNIREGRLTAAGIATTRYPTAQSVTWVQGDGIEPWSSAERCGIPATLTVEHVMASSSLPLVFPAAKLANGWHGDGGIRLTAPLSPLVQLGADRIIAISTSIEPGQSEADRPTEDYPPPATVMGVLLESVFLDMLDADACEMRRMNRLLAEHPKSKELGLRRVEALVIRPSQDLGVIASQFEDELPRTLRHIVRGLGSRETNRSDLIATLLFQPLFIRKMIEIGERDGLQRCSEIASFLGLPEPELRAPLPETILVGNGASPVAPAPARGRNPLRPILPAVRPASTRPALT
jgi:NTE family protein